MVEAILKFSLPVENEEYIHANKGCLYHCALLDFEAKLRQIRKYEGLSLSEEALFRRIESEFYNTIAHYDIKLS